MMRYSESHTNLRMIEFGLIEASKNWVGPYVWEKSWFQISSLIKKSIAYKMFLFHFCSYVSVKTRKISINLKKYFTFFSIYGHSIQINWRNKCYTIFSKSILKNFPKKVSIFVKNYVLPPDFSGEIWRRVGN